MTAEAPSGTALRSHACAQVEESLVGQQVQLCGWVHSRRDHGGVIFLDLRDHSGLCQVVADPARADSFALADSARAEYVLQVQGKVRPRPQGMVNESIASGRVEVEVEGIQVLAAAEAPAVSVSDEEAGAGEETRLRWRFLDLRRPSVQGRLRRRARLLSAFRAELERREFCEVETPVLIGSTPEGAREFLVPSRQQPEKAYALAQSPQLFKQMLMVGGLHRYYQVCRCFRDEDTRADRQPEFTQVDVEMSFVGREDLLQTLEGVFLGAMGAVLEPAVVQGFAPGGGMLRLGWEQAMDSYGSDKPDLRLPESMCIHDISQLVANEEFKVFAEPATREGQRVAVLLVPGGGGLSRGRIEAYTQAAQDGGAKGLAWIRVDGPAQGDGLPPMTSPIVKFLSEGCQKEILQLTGAGEGDMLFFQAGDTAMVREVLGELRLRAGEDLQLRERDWAACWVLDFPMFGLDERGAPAALHHPFTRPVLPPGEPLPQDPAGLAQLRAESYDLVLNGSEVAGGSLRIHDAELQLQVLGALGHPPAQAEERFGFLLRALRSGAPPHGGIAFGFDRLAMLATGSDSLRDVIAFPKTQNGACPLTGAPTVVEAQG